MSRRAIAIMTTILNPQQDLGGKTREETLKSRAQSQKEAVVTEKQSTSRDLHTILADVSGLATRRRSPIKERRGAKTRSQINQLK